MSCVALWSVIALPGPHRKYIQRYNTGTFCVLQPSGVPHVDDRVRSPLS